MVNWKTTVTGIVGASAYWLAAYLQSGKLDPKEIAIGLAVVVLGALAKDLNVTGGTVSQ